MGARLCGETRVPGAAYLEVAMGPTGQEIEEFLFDPPVPVDAQALGLSPIGVHAVSHHSLTHAFDIVGEQYYPNAADIIEETRTSGLSRRLPRTFPVDLLSPQSRIVLLHRRGYIANAADYQRAIFGRRHYWRLCPKGDKAHMDPGHWPERMCCGTWWHDLDEGTSPLGVAYPERVIRQLADGSGYRGWARPELVRPQYQLAMIAALPLRRIAVVRDPVGLSHRETLERFDRAGVRVTLVDE